MEENQCNYDLFEAPNGKEEVINFISIERWIIAAEWIITSSESTARTLGLSMSLGDFLFFSVRLFFCASIWVPYTLVSCWSTFVVVFGTSAAALDNARALKWQDDWGTIYSEQLCINQTKCDCFACKLQIINHLDVVSSVIYGSNYFRCLASFYPFARLSQRKNTALIRFNQTEPRWISIRPSHATQ